jgi:hypothetical protein
VKGANRRDRVLIVAIGALVVLATALPAPASTVQPSLTLRRATAQIVLHRTDPSFSVFLNGGVFVQSVDGALELQARRADYDEPIKVVQIITASDGTRTTRELPNLPVSSFSGALDAFFHVRLTSDAGDVLFNDDDAGFCPNGSDRPRIDGTGPDHLVYSDGCIANNWTLGTIWGIEQGWASSAADELSLDGPDGHYKLRVSVNEPYRTLFNMTRSSITVGVTLQTDACPAPCGMAGASSLSRGEKDQSAIDQAQVHAASRSEDRPHPPPSTQLASVDSSARPDLVPLPAWSMLTEVHDGRDYLDFAAMVWNRGPSPLVVEGFRSEDATYMNAFQYFYRDGTKVGQAPVGTMDYDPRPGHEHWHFENFARYVLTDGSKTEIVRSQKEAFCLVATDAMDLSLPGAALRPFATGLDSSCGTPDSIWIREVLHAGWGDTYTQSLPGQSFDITDLPNGTYFVKIRANPDRVLYESRLNNNVSYRRVILGGNPGDRTVRVPPYHSLDTEQFCFPFC